MYGVFPTTNTAASGLASLFAETPASIQSLSEHKCLPIAYSRWWNIAYDDAMPWLY